jgi:hypothetical protein
LLRVSSWQRERLGRTAGEINVLHLDFQSEPGSQRVQPLRVVRPKIFSLQQYLQFAPVCTKVGNPLRYNLGAHNDRLHMLTYKVQPAMHRQPRGEHPDNARVPIK